MNLNTLYLGKLEISLLIFLMVLVVTMGVLIWVK